MATATGAWALRENANKSRSEQRNGFICRDLRTTEVSQEKDGEMNSPLQNQKHRSEDRPLQTSEARTKSTPISVVCVTPNFGESRQGCRRWISVIDPPKILHRLKTVLLRSARRCRRRPCRRRCTW